MCHVSWWHNYTDVWLLLDLGTGAHQPCGKIDTWHNYLSQLLKHTYRQLYHPIDEIGTWGWTVLSQLSRTQQSVITTNIQLNIWQRRVQNTFFVRCPSGHLCGENITEQFDGSDLAKPAFLWDFPEMQIEKDWERSSLISLQCSKVTCWCYQLCSWVNQSLRLWWQKSVDIGYLKKIIPASSTSWPSVNWRPWMNSHYETLWIK